MISIRDVEDIEEDGVGLCEIEWSGLATNAAG